MPSITAYPQLISASSDGFGWSNLPGALTQDDTYAESGGKGVLWTYIGGPTAELQASGFDWGALPSNIRITGLKVDVGIRGVDEVKEFYVGIRLGTETRQKTGSRWFTPGVWSYGGDGDLWGFASVQRADLDTAQVLFRGYIDGWGTAGIQVDFLRLTVFYVPVYGDPNDPDAPTVPETATLGIYGKVLSTLGEIVVLDTPSEQLPAGVAVSWESGGNIAASHIGLRFWVDTPAGRQLWALANIPNDKTPNGKLRISATWPNDRGVDIFVFKAPGLWAKLKTLRGTFSETLDEDPTMVGTPIRIAMECDLAAVHNNRHVEVTNYLAEFPTTFGKPTRIDLPQGFQAVVLHPPGEPQASNADWVLVPGKVTGLASTQEALYIFTRTETYALFGDLVSLQSTQLQRLGTPVGCDHPYHPPVVVGGVVYTIWQQRLFAIQGGQVQEVSLPVWTPSRPVSWVAYDAASDTLLASVGTDVLRYDPKRNGWTTVEELTSAAILPAYAAAPTIHPANVAWVSGGPYEEASLELPPIDCGTPSVVKQFHHVVFYTNNLSGELLEAAFATDDRPQGPWVRGRSPRPGTVEFRLGRLVGREIRIWLRIPPEAIAGGDANLRPPIEIHYIPLRGHQGGRREAGEIEVL